MLELVVLRYSLDPYFCKLDEIFFGYIAQESDTIVTFLRTFFSDLTWCDDVFAETLSYDL